MVLLSAPSTIVQNSEAMLTLTVGGERRSFRLLDATLIGSGEECQLRMHRPGVAPVHCVLRQKGPHWILESRSPNADVERNGESIREAILTDGDRLRIAGVSMDFHSLGANPSTVVAPPQPRPTPAASLAEKQTELDVCFAKMEADRNAWIRRMDQERRQIEELRAKWSTEWRDREKLLRLRQKQSQIRLAQQRDELDAQSTKITEATKQLEKRKEEIRHRERTLSERLERFESELATKRNAVARSQSAAVRLLAHAQHESRKAKEQHREAAEEREHVRGEAALMECELETRRRELADLETRVTRQRRILEIATSPISSTAQKTILPPQPDWLQQATKSAADANASSATAQIEELLRILEFQLHHLEAVADEMELADRRVTSERHRLEQIARSLELREEELRASEQNPFTDEEQRLANFARELSKKEMTLAQFGQQLEAERSRLATEQSSWRQVQALEQSALEREREEIRQQRKQSGLAHRQQARQLRERRNELAAQQKELSLRVAHMLRLQDHLEHLRQEISSERLGLFVLAAELEAVEPAPGHSRRVAFERAATIAKQHQMQAREQLTRYQTRLTQTLDILEAVPPAKGGQLASNTNQPSRIAVTAEIEQLEAALTELSIERTAEERRWIAEKGQLVQRISELEVQLENLAASMVQPWTIEEAQETPSRAA